MLKPKTCIGLDVGHGDIRLVELRKSGRKFDVLQAVRIPLPAQSSSEVVASALAAYLIESRTPLQKVVCSLPSEICSVKFAQVPKAKPVETARMVRFEAESQIPMPLSELVWDFTESGEKTEAMKDVVISAARRSDVESFLQTITGADLRPSALVVSAIAGVESVQCAGLPGQPMLVVDIGSQWTDICVVDGGRVLSCRSVRIGSDDLTNAYAGDFKVPLEEAERLKQTHGIAMDARLQTADPTDRISAVEVWADRIAEEMRRTTLSSGSTPAGIRPQRAILIGGSAVLPALTDGLSRRSGLTVVAGDPWSAMKLGEVCEHTIREPSTAFAVATGLAVMGLSDSKYANLMPQHIAEERIRKRKETTFLTAMSAVAAVLLVVYLAGGSGIEKKAAELKKLTSQVRTAQAQVRQVGPSIRPAAQVVKGTVTDVEKKDSSGLELLRLLSIHLPRSMWLSEFSYETGKSMVLKGGALSNFAVADAVDTLNQLEKFENVTLDYSNLARGENSQGYEFQITCALPGYKKGPGKKQSGSKKMGAGNETGIVVQ